MLPSSLVRRLACRSPYRGDQRESALAMLSTVLSGASIDLVRRILRSRGVYAAAPARATLIL